MGGTGREGVCVFCKGWGCPGAQDSHSALPCSQLHTRTHSHVHTANGQASVTSTHSRSSLLSFAFSSRHLYDTPLSCQSVLAWEAGLGPGIAQVRARSGRVRAARTQMKVSWSDFIDCQELCDFLVPSDSWEASFVPSSRWRGSVPSG